MTAPPATPTIVPGRRHAGTASIASPGDTRLCDEFGVRQLCDERIGIALRDGLGPILGEYLQAAAGKPDYIAEIRPVRFFIHRRWWSNTVSPTLEWRFVLRSSRTQNPVLQLQEVATYPGNIPADDTDVAVRALENQALSRVNELLRELDSGDVPATGPDPM
jgi:hypothetical protein